MAAVPATSVTLLKGLASDARSARWTEFYRIYEGPMRAYLRANFPSIDADDALQETMCALARALPDYHYTPDEKGHFRSYLLGILKHKAQDAVRRSARESRRLSAMREDALARRDGRGETAADDDREWMADAMNAALEQLLTDASVSPATREIFRHAALMHESPESVAEAFGVSRNNVDVIKSRMTRRLAALVSAMTAER